jgi:hypothetical protein
MPGKMARSPDRTAFGTAGTRAALRSPPTASGELHRLLSSTPLQSFIWGMSVKNLISPAMLQRPAPSRAGEPRSLDRPLPGFSDIVTVQEAQEAM